MGQSKRTAASYLAEQRNTTVNPFEGLTKQKMKELYDEKIRGSGKSSKELKKIADQMQAALRRSAKKSSGGASKTQTTRQQQTPTTPTKPRQQRRTATSSSTKPETNSKAKSEAARITSAMLDDIKKRKSGTRGKFRGSNPPSPTVVRPGSNTGATVDPRERSLRKNREESKRKKGSTVEGRKNIAAQVREASGSSKRNQKLVEARRRRAREEALKKNLREMFASKYNN